VKDFHPLSRILEPVVLEALGRFPVVVLTGARQTGKTTLVASGPIAKGRTYRSLDDYDVLERAAARPSVLLQDGEQLTLDEVQRAPELLRAIKREVDRSRRKGRFLLTGSANLLMMRRISETLAGRAVYLTLWPMTEAEKRGAADAGPWGSWIKARDASSARPPASRTSGERWPPRALAGGYPVPALAAVPTERAQWFDGYVRTYLERDLQEISSISSLADFRRLMKLAALRVGRMLNQTELARDAALSLATAHRYLNLLEVSYQIVRLPAFGTSRTKRLVKTPKLYWTDTGLAAHLAGLGTDSDAGEVPGALLENLVLTQILAWRETAVPRPEVFYWRTHGGAEVDFVIESGRRLLPIEVKASTRVRPADAKGLDAFLEDHPKAAPFGILLYGGREPHALSERLLAVPLDAIWSE
jgi:predicted AAA+ superfamily ATPase